VFLAPLSSRAVDPHPQTLLLSVSLSRLGGKHRQLERQVGDFGSWACTADGSGSFSNHLATPISPKPKTISQLADIRESADLDEKGVLPELDSDNPENVSTPTRTLGSVEFDTNSDSEKLHFSETLGKYLTHLNTIKHPKIENSELLDGVNQVSPSNS
jgi:hypothetical protein